jgi:hypothetical protein
LESISESEAAPSVLGEILEEGVSVYLVMDDPSTGEEPEALRLLPESVEESSTPGFRIDQTDLSLLKSLGIDPTRTLRRGRQARRR